MNKTVLITGANKGIGFEIACQLGALGWQIWLGTRNPEKGQKAANAPGDKTGHFWRDRRVVPW